MADGMFNYTDPRLLQQAYTQQFQLSPQQMASLPLLNQVAAMGGNAGATIGAGLGRLFGGQSAMEAENAVMKDIFTKAAQATTDPIERMTIAAQGLREKGLEGRAMQLEEQIQKTQLGQAQISAERAKATETQAKMEQEQAAYAMRFQALKTRNPDMSDEEARSIAADPVAFREALKETTIKFSTDAEEVSAELFNKSYSALTPNERAQVNALRAERDRANRAAGASRLNVDARSITQFESEYGKKVGAAQAEEDVSAIQTAPQVAATLPKMYETLDLIETGNLNTGIAANALTVLDRAKSKFLADEKAGKRVRDTEYLDALLGSDVFPQIAALGIGARGLDTPAEREFLRQVITGTVSLDRETLRRMTEFRIKAAERAIKSYNKRLEEGGFDDYQRVTRRKLRPIELPDRRQEPASDTDLINKYLNQ